MLEEFRNRNLVPLKSYLDNVSSETPHQYFQDGERMSEIRSKFDKADMIVRSKFNYANRLTAFVLQSIPEYAGWFKEVYKDEKITMDNVADAIAAFEETLTTPNSRFDWWLKDYENKISEFEKEGYDLFKAKGCINCHNGFGVGGNSFQKFGIAKPYDKDTQTLGRYSVTKDEKDKYVFKVPLLRNIALTAPYFHDASTWSLSEAVHIMAEYQLGVTLTGDETNKIVAFLRTLTGDQPSIIFPILPPSTANTQKPDRN